MSRASSHSANDRTQTAVRVTLSGPSRAVPSFSLNPHAGAVVQAGDTRTRGRCRVRTARFHPHSVCIPLFVSPYPR